MTIKTGVKEFEKRDFVTRFLVREDPNKKLGEILGERFIKYRKEWDDCTASRRFARFPLCLVVEPVDNCNLNCRFCYRAHGVKNSHAYLSLEMFKKIMDDAGRFQLPSVGFAIGEPLLHKELIDMIKIAKSKGVMDIIVTTNGMLLTEDISFSMINSGVTKLHISVDAAFPDTYKKIRGGSLEKLEKNIYDFLRIRRESNSILPFVRLSFLCVEDNKSERKFFLEKWSSLVDYIDFQDCVSFDEVDRLSPVEVDEFDCPDLYKSLTIRANGDIQACCTFYGKHLVMGNANVGDAVSSVWNGKRLGSLRKSFQEGDYPVMCKHCMGKIKKGFSDVKTV